MTHTKGPWRNDERRIRTTIHGRIIRIAEVFDNENANLIATAPELLEALKEMCFIFGYGYLTGPQTDAIKSASLAINKAEGKQ